MVKKFKSWLNILFLTLILIIPGLVFADNAIIKSDPVDRLNQAALNSGGGPYTTQATGTTLASTLGIVISVALSILGIIFLIIMIIAGFKWMTAQGNEDQVTKAKDSIARAVIGLVVILSSYAVWFFIKTYFIEKL